MKVYIGMASATGSVQIETMMAMLDTLLSMRERKIKVISNYTVRDSLNFARNRFVASFLASDATDLIMIDDDVQWENGAVLRLLSHDVDLVGGVYPKREDPLRYPVRRLPWSRIDKNGLMEVEMLPAGFLRMTRSCAERMWQAAEKFEDQDAPGGWSAAMFLPQIMDKELVGEDFAFCRKWRELGGRVWMDALLSFKHVGRKGFEGCYAESLAAAHKETARNGDSEVRCSA